MCFLVLEFHSLKHYLHCSLILVRASWKQECIPVGCVPPAAVAVRGCLHPAPPWEQAPPPEGPDPLGPGPPGTRHHPGTRHLPPVDRMTDRCKHITLPQTSFAGGNNTNMLYAQCHLPFWKNVRCFYVKSIFSIWQQTYSTQVEDPTLLSLWTWDFFHLWWARKGDVELSSEVGIVNVSWKNQTGEETLNSRPGVPHFTSLWTHYGWTLSILDTCNGFQTRKVVKGKFWKIRSWIRN